MPSDDEHARLTAASSATYPPPPSSPVDRPRPTPPSTASDAPTAPRLFDVAHSRRRPVHVDNRGHRQHVVEADAPLSWRHLFSRPVVRQFTVGDVLVREKEEREAGGFELFFDLMMVAIISKLAEQVGEADSSWGVFIFGVFFWLAWTTWNDARAYINVSGTNDISCRIYILVMMCLLVGFVANAIAIDINCSEGDEGDSTTDDDYFGEPFLLPGGCYLESGWLRSIRAALTFFLIARALRIALLIMYGVWLPRFRRAHFIRAFALLVGSCMWVPLTHVYAPLAFVVLPLIAFVTEIAFQFISTPLLQLSMRRARRDIKRGLGSGSHPLLPTLNLEHSLERTFLFVVLVIGEMVTSTLYKAEGEWAGIALVFLRSVFGLFIAFTILWVFQEQAGARTFSSAPRRHWLSSTTWQFFHFPMSAGLILAASETSNFVKEGQPAAKRRWIYGGGLSCVFLCLFLLGLLHKPLDKHHSALIPRPIRLGCRLVCSLLFALLPLIPDHEGFVGATFLLGVTSAALLVLLIVESVGQLGSVADEERVREEVALHAARSGDSPSHDIEKTSPPSATAFPDSPASSSGPSATEELARLFGAPAFVGVEEYAEAEGFDLDPVERGAETTGVDSGLGELVVARVRGGQRFAYTF